MVNFKELLGNNNQLQNLLLDTVEEGEVYRLQSAAADPDMRYQMNAEDEFFKELEARDSLIMEKDGQLKEKDGQLKEKDGQLKEKDEMLHKMITGMLENGMSLDDIAKMLNKTVDEVKQIL